MLAQVEGFLGDAELGKALEGADLVVIPAGVPRKPGMTRDDLFNINAGIVKSLTEACAKHCPNVRTQFPSRLWAVYEAQWLKRSNGMHVLRQACTKLQRHML